MQIRDATPDEEKAFFGKNDPAIKSLRCAIIDGTVVAMSGLYKDPSYFGSVFEDDGRWIAFLSVSEDAPPLGWQVVVAMRQFLKTQTEPIIVQQDDAHPTSHRLLTAIGFRRTQKQLSDFRDPKRKLRIWEWQPSPQSQ